MDNTLLVSLSHQLASYRSMDVIANNIANASTPAFKREAVQFQEYVEQVAPAEGQTGPQSLSFVQDKGIVRDLSEGKLERTNAPFDFAVNGKGYFAVQTANGERYTRNGHFALDGQGKLVTSEGDEVLGEGGGITVTPDDGDIHVAEDGTVSGAHGQLGKLRLVGFDNETELKKEGASLYSTDQSSKPVDNPKIEQGTIETSNVQPVIEISHMLEVMRAYQATANLTQSQEDLARQAIDKLGSVPN
ncbi:MAG TPA: flagellar basal-body rod protein FlgF [Rhizomicrobium sp.]|nr:flagellar basal-body rod protein FlgF [Rhizomicrobium sp.]